MSRVVSGTGRRPSLLPVLLGLGMLAAWVPLLLGGRREASITFLDVGQGDCILVRAPGGRTLLIDGGGQAEVGEEPESRAGSRSDRLGERVVVPALKRLGVRRLDAVLATHPHEDHCGGLSAVLRRFPVGLVLDSGLPSASEGHRRLLALARERRVPVRVVRRGARLNLGDGMILEFLHPGEPPLSGTRSDENNNSVVGLLRYGTIRVLLPGDLEAEAERRLLPFLEPVSLLKVAHHGSHFATSIAFLKRLRPRIAVISCGAGNPFGHPDGETLQRLRSMGVTVYRTDLQGAVTARLRPEGIAVEVVRG